MTSTRIQAYHGSYLMPSLVHASVSDAMHPGVLSCEASASLLDVARMMATHHVHCVVVMGGSDQHPGERPVWGIVSDIDLLHAGIRGGADESAGALATQPVITVAPTMPLREAGELMLAHGVSHVVVAAPGSELPIGILSTLDIAGVLAWGEA